MISPRGLDNRRLTNAESPFPCEPASNPDPHADMPHEVTVISGRRFPTCRHCKGISFELAHAARHVGEIDHLEEAHAPAG